MEEQKKVNPLATEKEGKLIAKFAIPAIISMLVSSLYNIVDQIFIGQGVGLLGNAATNIAFPVSIICTATALLLGIGSASNFNLCSGAGDHEKASRVAGTGLSMLVICGVIIAAVVLVFLNPLLHLFGVTAKILPYAQDYTGITAFGIPFLILTTGGNHLIRADRSPTYSMTCMLTGAIINTILDPLFIFGFHWGIKGAAWATVIGQIVSGIMVIVYFGRFRKMELKKEMFWPRGQFLKMILSLGMASCINQIAMAVVQITASLRCGFRIWNGYSTGVCGSHLQGKYGVHGDCNRDLTGMPANLGIQLWRRILWQGKTYVLESVPDRNDGWYRILPVFSVLPDTACEYLWYGKQRIL